MKYHTDLNTFVSPITSATNYCRRFVLMNEA